MDIMSFINDNIVWLIIIVVIIILAVIGYIADKSGFSQRLNERKAKENARPIDEPEEKIEFKEPELDNNNIFDNTQNSNEDNNSGELIFNDSDNQEQATDTNEEISFDIPESTKEVEEQSNDIPVSNEEVTFDNPNTTETNLNNGELVFTDSEQPEEKTEETKSEDNNVEQPVPVTEESNDELIFKDSDEEPQVENTNEEISFDIPQEKTEEAVEEQPDNKESQEVVFNDPEVQNQFFPSEEKTETINIEEQPVNTEEQPVSIEETTSDNSNNELDDTEEDDIWKF